MGAGVPTVDDRAVTRTNEGEGTQENSGTGLLDSMCADLGITIKDLNNV